MNLTGRIACALAAAYTISVAAASADLTVEVVPKTYILGSGTSNEYFDVVVTDSVSDPDIDIEDTVARVFQDVVNPNIVFGTPIQTNDVTTTNPVTPIHSSGFFNHNGSVPNTPSNVSDNYGGGVTDTLYPGTILGLMRVPFTVLNGYTGSLLIDIDSTTPFQNTFLTDPNTFEGLPYTPQSGTLTIVSSVPEPASLLLLALGAPLLLRRRVRR